MKIAFIAVALACSIFLAITAPAQARRISQPASTEKSNRRPVPVETPTAQGTTADDATAEEDNTVVAVETEIVTVPVRVVDRKGRFVGGLTKDSFKVLENGTEQEISYFTNESQPFTVALVLDMSYSTTFKIAEIQSAAIQFIDQLRPADRVLVVSFAQEVLVLSEVTDDRKQIYSAIMRARITTGTSLYDALDMVVNNKLSRLTGRKAMVLFTDGVDTTSEISHDAKNLRDVSESDTLVYPIRYDTYNDVQRLKNAPAPAGLPGSLPQSTPPTMPTSDPTGLPFPLPSIGVASSKGTSREEYDRAELFLNELAERTGGRTHVASTIDNLTDAFRRIASELREIYSLGYAPAAEHRPGETVKLKVRVDRPDTAVRARTSYTVPKKRSIRK